MTEPLKAPFPYFGGKSSIAADVWQRFGAVRNYVEPFFGSGAMLLNRPQPFDGTETVNDADGLVANFWRAVQADPDAVALYADWPVNENDLHARHVWLVGQKDSLQTRLDGDHEFFDAKIAGWWCWGMCCWLFHRLSRVRVCSGDWSRVCGPTVTVKQGLTAVFLDPPYADTAGRQADLYRKDCLDVAHAVREWAIENGGDKQMRIALCGYEGEHQMPDDWECLEWKAKGGYGSQGDDEESAGRANSRRERIWFSPHCLKANRDKQRGLFA